MIRAKVSLIRLDPAQTETMTYLEEKVEEAVALVGGWGRFLKPGDHVFIKANEFIPQTLESGFITNPLLVIAVAKACRHAGAGRVTVGELSSVIKENFRPYAEIYNYAEVVDLSELPHTHRCLPGAESLRGPVTLPTIVDECDVFINMPGLRTHALPLFSNAMKNLMGLLPLGNTAFVHMYGLEGAVVDLNFYRPSDLVITDAIYSLEDNFPSEGRALKTDLIMAADNVVAADAVAARIIGFAPEEVAYLREAAARGLGPLSLEKMEIRGEPLAEITRTIHFVKAPTDYRPFTAKIPVVDHAACAACRRALAGGLTAASHRPEFTQVKDLTIVTGPLEEEPVVTSKNVILFGNCTYRWRHLGRHVQGCPPLSGQACGAVLETVKSPPKFSFCSLGAREEKLEEIIPRVAALGYDGIEIWGNHLEDYLARQGGGGPVAAGQRVALADAAGLTTLRTLLQTHGLAVPMLSPYFNFVGDAQAYQESRERAERFLEYARALGAPLLRVFLGPAASQEATHAQWRQATLALKELARKGQEKGVGLALETHQGQLMDTVQSTLRLLRQVDAPNLKVNLDIHNLFAMGEEPVAALTRLYPYVAHIHAKNGRREDGRLRHGIPLAAADEPGNMDYRSFFAALREKGYAHFISVEWFGENVWEAARTELAFLRGMFAAEGE